jgi:hypothetical protein
MKSSYLEKWNVGKLESRIIPIFQHSIKDLKRQLTIKNQKALALNPS